MTRIPSIKDISLKFSKYLYNFTQKLDQKSRKDLVSFSRPRCAPCTQMLNVVCRWPRWDPSLREPGTRSVVLVFLPLLAMDSFYRKETTVSDEMTAQLIPPPCVGQHALRSRCGEALPHLCLPPADRFHRAWDPWAHDGWGRGHYCQVGSNSSMHTNLHCTQTLAFLAILNQCILVSNLMNMIDQPLIDTN